MEKAKNLLPEEGNQSANITGGTLVKPVTKETMAKVPTTSLNHADAKANAKVTGATVPLAGGGTTRTTSAS